MPDLEYVQRLELHTLPLLEKWDADKRKIAAAVNVSFPMLENAGDIDVGARLSGLALPELATLGDTEPEASRYSYSSFSHYGDPIALELAKLTFVDGNLDFRGNISSLSLRSLRNVTGYFAVDTGSEFSVSLPLENADSIRFHGNIESIERPNLRNWSTLSMSSELRFDCDEFVGRLNETNSNNQPGEVQCESLKTIEDLYGPGIDLAGSIRGRIRATVAAVVLVGVVAYFL